jgi:hypothetical protein
MPFDLGKLHFCTPTFRREGCEEKAKVRQEKRFSLPFADLLSFSAAFATRHPALKNKYAFTAPHSSLCGPLLFLCAFAVKAL